MLSLGLALAGCGGGGDSGDTPLGTDNLAPTATLTAPASLAAGLTGTIALAATASDNVGVASVEFQIDGVAIGAADTSSPYGATLDTSAYPSGQHVLRARASDAAGNVSPWSTALVQFGGGVTQPAGFTRNESWVTGLSNATAFAQAPDGRLFIAEQGGTLRVVRNGSLLAAPFASFAVDSAGERGLIGVALHPAFASNGFVYVYSTRSVGGVSHNRISRLTAAGDVAAAGSEIALVDLPNLSGATNHNGGGMHFGADGKLYVGVGENANPAQAQDLTLPFGKLLRFNDDGTIPTDNPFVAQAGAAKAIWAYGLRNPYTFAVQPGTGRIHINDVGQNTWEEIDVGTAGANYGWPGSEGPDNLGAGLTGPLFTYKHADANPLGSGPGGFFKGFAIAGGTFYPSAGPFPAGYRDQYYFADYISQFVGRLDMANGNAAYAFASLSGSPVDLLVGLDGAVHVLTRSGVTRISMP
ncbi:MAG: PQQ-dependent sugar dehydrogenase [Caldimonas sp.]